MTSHETLKAYLLALQEFWKVVWIEEKPLKEEQATDDGVFHYLDFGEHFDAVQLFCSPVERKLYIHQEYVDAFESFESNLDTYEKGACIIGQSGIGKTCFIAYAVFERLRKKEPVAVEVSWKEYTRQYLLFAAEGVTLHDSSDRPTLRRHPGIWAFSDSDEDILIPMTAFTRTPGVRTFQATSPRQVRYKEWTKQRRVSHYIMNIPSEKDILHLSLVLGKDVTTMRSLAAQWGNVPRTLLNLYDNRSAQRIREQLVHEQVDKRTEDMSMALGVLNSLDTTSPDGPSAIFFIQAFRTESGDLDRQHHEIFIPTRWLRDEVADGILRREEGERAKFLKLMTGSMVTRTTAERVFESIVYKFLSGGNKSFVRWYTNPVHPQPVTSLSLPTLPTRTANVDLQAVDTPFFYWRLESENFPGIDGAIFTADCIYLIQVTIAMTHIFNPDGVNNFQDALPADRKALPKKLLVVGHTKRQTDEVAKDLISQVRKADIEWDVGSITIDVDAGFEATVSCRFPVEDRFITSARGEQMNEDTS